MIQVPFREPRDIATLNLSESRSSTNESFNPRVPNDSDRTPLNSDHGDIGTTTSGVRTGRVKETLTRLSDTGPNVAVKNVCIEIKPKQGFLDYSTPDLPLCRYCVKQFLKVIY